MAGANARTQAKDEERGQKKKKTRIKRTLRKQQKKAEKILREEDVTNNKLVHRTGEILLSERDIRSQNSASKKDDENNTVDKTEETQNQSLRQRAQRLREVREQLTEQAQKTKQAAEIVKKRGKISSQRDAQNAKEILENPIISEEVKDEMRTRIYRNATGRNILEKSPLKRKKSENRLSKDAVVQNEINKKGQRGQ